jgi:hypothetical protein
MLQHLFVSERLSPSVRERVPSGHTRLRRSGIEPPDLQCTLDPSHSRADDRAMLEELPRDLMARLGYRIAYGEAARLAEMARFDHRWGRDFAAQVGGEAEAIEREVMRRVSHTIHPELIKLAVKDAVEQRKPRW